jgi:hypothetical protein
LGPRLGSDDRDGQEREFTVNVSLVSTASKEGEIQYSLIAKGKNSHPLWLVNSPRSSEELPDAVCIVWESANSVFLRQHLEKPNSLANAEEKKPLRISLKVEDKTIVKDGSAVLYFRGKEFARFGASYVESSPAQRRATRKSLLASARRSMLVTSPPLVPPILLRSPFPVIE